MYKSFDGGLGVKSLHIICSYTSRHHFFEFKINKKELKFLQLALCAKARKIRSDLRRSDSKPFFHNCESIITQYYILYEVSIFRKIFLIFQE